jgi:hypothetical protein
VRGGPSIPPWAPEDVPDSTASATPPVRDIGDGKLHLPRDRLLIRAGGQLFANFTTAVDVEMGTDFDLEDDLGLDADVFSERIDLDWRLGQNHHVVASYYGINRSASNTITGQIEFEDVVFDIGVRVAATMDIDIVRLAYRYDIWRDRRTEVGISLGAHTMLLNVDLAGQGVVNGMGGAVQVSRSAEVAAPLPVLGANVNWIVAKDLILRTGVDFFALEVGGFKGRLIDSLMVLEWRAFEHFGFGLGYNRFLIDVQLDMSDYEGDFEYTYNGLLFFLSGHL